MEPIYYILKDGVTNDNQALDRGPVIMKLTENLIIPFMNGEGPYQSLTQLKSKSPFYQSLKKTDINRAQKIVEDKHIFTPANFVLIPKGTEFKAEVVDAFTHAVGGRIKKGNITGVHLYDPQKIKILEVINVNDNTKVFNARFKYYNHRTDKWIEKKTPSTFFPRNWNLSKLIMECKYTFDRIDKGELKDGKYHSVTESNIPVVIIIRNGKLKTLYPEL